MKLLIVTVVEQYEKDILQLFRKSGIENFSESNIDGYKNSAPIRLASNWFPSETSGVSSSLFFSFTEEKNIDALFQFIEEFNRQLETNNPIKAIVVPIEKSI